MPFMTYHFFGFGFIVAGLIISVVASLNVKATFAKYSKVQSRDRTPANAVAENILRNSDAGNVNVEHTAGNLTDHYDPRSKTVRLSDSVYNSASVAAIGVAAHECGHAIQHSTSYAPITVRNAILPAVNFGSSFSGIAILLGLMIEGMFYLVDFGILLFCLVILFQLITLPVEFNASARASDILERTGRYERDELKAVRKVLNAAAMTYVAALVVSILQLIRLIGLRNSRR